MKGPDCDEPTGGITSGEGMDAERVLLFGMRVLMLSTFLPDAKRSFQKMVPGM